MPEQEIIRLPYVQASCTQTPRGSFFIGRFYMKGGERCVTHEKELINHTPTGGKK